MIEQHYCILDYETKSEADLKKVGSAEYARHPTTQIMCVAWRHGTRETLATAPIYRHWFKNGEYNVAAGITLKRTLRHPRFIFVAHNAGFEQMITEHVLFRGEDYIADPEEWMCTAALAAVLALPRDLEGACIALRMKVQKDMEGRRLMLKHSKPRKPTKNNPAKWHDDPEEQKRILAYCVQDIEAETQLFLTLPSLTPTERRVWVLDQIVNRRGIKIDRPLVKTTLQLIDQQVTILNAETSTLTDGAIETTNKRAKVLAWLKENGVALPNLQKKTVEDALAAGMATGKAKRIMEIRQSISKTSTAKYQAFEMRSRFDGIVREIMMYHGASTGRFTGTGVQVHNFPRGSIKDTYTAVEIVKHGDLEACSMLYGDPMNLFSSCLRSAIVARDGDQFFCGDYASIEVRVLFWVAEHAAGIRAYHEKRDLYIEMAKEIYHRKALTDVTKPEREVGKRAILGCGYGMGKDKFFETCKQFGQEVSTDLAKRAVDAYRSTHQKVPKLWYNLEMVAISAVRNPGKAYTINRTKWFVRDGFLWCQLPSGRRLAYARPGIYPIKTAWGDMKDTLHHWGVHPKTKQWTLQKTWGGTLTENVVQAIARDIMAEASLRLEENGYRVALSVHDELLCERAGGDLDEFRNLMAQPPEWGKDIPISTDCWSGKRYKK
jgi:DNA polymerase